MRHKPLPARFPRGRQPVTDQVATIKARVAELEFDLAAELERSAGHRADFERERERADRMVTAQDKLIAELESLRALLEAAPARGPPGHHPDMARDVLARAHGLAAHDWLTNTQSNRKRNPAMRLTTIAHHITPFAAVAGGILVLLMPRLLNYIIAIYLILVGVIGLNGLYHFVR